MERWEAERVRERGNGKEWHYLNTPEDCEYVHLLWEWAVGVDGDGAEDEDRKVGKTPPRWGAKELWMRTRIAEMKRAFGALGEGRRDVRTLEALGFDYERWRVESAEEAGKMEEGLVRKISRENAEGKINDAAGGQAEGDL